MESGKKYLKTFAELLKESLKNLPTDEWKCEECGNINNTWFPDIQYIMTYKTIKYKKGICQSCREKLDKEEEKLQKIEEKNKKRNKINEILNASQIPPKILNSKFELLQQCKGNDIAFKTLRKLDKADRWIYIFGDNTTGKTMLAGASINLLSQKLISSYYFNERTLFRRLKDSFTGKENQEQIFKKLKESDIIFWDDFSTLEYTTWQMGIVYDILEYCETYYKIIVFISNINLKNALATSKKTVENRIGKRIIARILRNKTFFIEMKNKPFDNM